MEYLVARIDTPLLDTLHITFFHQLIFDTQQLAQFFARTPNIQPPVDARIILSDRYVEVTSPQSFPSKFVLGVSCGQSDWQLSSLTQVCSSSFPEAFIPSVGHLYIYEVRHGERRWQDDIEAIQWLEVLLPFNAVKHFYLSRDLASHVAPALQELTEEVLPFLQSLFLEDIHPPKRVREAIEKLVAARQLAGHPIVVSHWAGN